MPETMTIVRCAWLTLLVGWPAAASAYEAKRLVVELNAPRDELPTHACVVYANAGRDGAHSMPTSEQPAGGYALQSLDAASNEHGRAVYRVVRLVEGTDAAAGASTSATAIALTTLSQKAGAQGMCGEAECDPRFTFPQTATQRPLVTCASNPRVSEGGRVLLLHVRLPGDREGTVDGLTLDGAVIGLIGSWGGAQPTMHVLGGHYFSGDAASAGADGLIQLRVQTRCVRRELRLPPLVRRATSQKVAIAIDPTGRGETSGAASERGQDDPCWRELCGEEPSPGCVGDTLPTMLARGRETRRVTATLQLPAIDGTGSGARLRTEARWHQDAPPDPLQLRVFDVRFTWTDRCEFYGEGNQVCPTADLIEAGISCAGRLLLSQRPGGHPQRHCRYHCASPTGGAAFELPLTVRFAAGHQEDAWRERLSHVDQTLSGFTPESKRQFPLALDPEAKEKRRGDGLEKVRIWTPAGLRYELSVAALRNDQPARPVVGQPRITTALKTSPPLTIPGGRCGLPLRYQYIGTRDFDEAVTQIRDGLVYIPPPSETAVRWTWGGLVAPALAKSWLTDTSLESAPLPPSLLIQLATRWHRTLAADDFAWSGEAAASFLFSETTYYPLALPGTAAEPRVETAHSWRLGGEVAIMLPQAAWTVLQDGWGFGLIAGGGVRVPAFDSDADVLDVSGFFVTGLFVRSPVRAPVWLEFSVRYYPAEGARRFTFHDNELLGAPSEASLSSHTLLFAFGPRVWL